MSRREFVARAAALGIGAPMSLVLVNSVSVDEVAAQETPFERPSTGTDGQIRGAGGELSVRQWLSPNHAFAHLAGFPPTIAQVSSLVVEPLLSYAPGGSLLPTLARVKSVMDLGSPALTQAVAVRLLGQIDRVRTLRCEQLRPRRDALVRRLRRALPEWTFTVPTGGLFLWVELPAGDAQEFAQLALRRGVVIVPGSALSHEGRYERFMRLPFLAEPAVLAAGVERLRTAWADYSAAGARRTATAAVAMV